MRTLLAAGQLLVVEVDDDAWLGTVEVVGESFVIRTGYRGHPVVVPFEDVERLTLASEHDDVDVAQQMT